MSISTSVVPEQIPQNNQAWADRLRNWATILVITIHVSGPVAHNNTEYNTWYWWSANLWDSFARPSVPLFIMLSGFLLLGKDYPLGNFLKRRFSRVAIPWLFWSVVYSIYNHLSTNDPATFKDAFLHLIQNQVHYHLWFIYLILGLYLTYPILNPWVRSAREEDFWYFFTLAALGTWVYKALSQGFDIHIGLYFELFTNQVGTFVLGYYLGTKFTATGAPGERISPWPVSHKQLLWISVALIVLGTAATAYGTFWASTTRGNVFNSFFYDYLTPNVGLNAAGWFIFAQLMFQRPALFDFEKEFAAASFGIYFIHVLVLDWWSKSGYWAYKFHPAKCIPIIICLVSLMSFLWIILIRALPGGKKIT
ncbi:MAG: acyltransferase family protein [Bacteroidota bacterium]